MAGQFSVQVCTFTSSATTRISLCSSCTLKKGAPSPIASKGSPFGLITKSNLILGLGETREEISQALVDLHAAGCDLITITQYLRPTNKHHPVERWVKPDEFVELAKEADDIGFSGVMSGPLVRSSYRAGRLYRQAQEKRSSVG